MGNAQQMHYVENKRQFELAQNKILNRLNEQGYFEHNGLTCWNNPFNDDTEPEAFRPQWLEEEYHIIFNKEAGEYCVIGDDEKMQRERKREYQGKRIAQYLANRACADHSGEKTVWLDVTGCVKRGYPWVRKLADDPQMLARLTMLSCHLHYNKRKLMKLRTYGHESMRRRDARSLLGLNNKTFQDFWTDVIMARRITGNEEDGYKLFLPVRYGEIQGRDDKGHVVEHKSKHLQRLYTEAYDRLYHFGGVVCEPSEENPDGFRRLTSRDHYLVGRLLQLVPYVHKNLNCLCRNPLCEEECNVEDLTEADTAKLLGIDAKHQSRDVEKLCRVTFPVGSSGEETQQYVLLHIVDTHGNSRYVMNPRLIFSGRAECKDKICKRYSFIADNRESGEVYGIQYEYTDERRVLYTYPCV